MKSGQAIKTHINSVFLYVKTHLIPSKLVVGMQMERSLESVRSLAHSYLETSSTLLMPFLSSSLMREVLLLGLRSAPKTSVDWDETDSRMS